MNIVFIALGSNINPRLEYLKKAMRGLSRHPEITMINESSIYETEPIGYENQSNFLNMVVKIETSLEPTKLLTYCQRIEAELGRKREIRWGPRTIDLDILLFNEENIKLKNLTIPHPRIQERAFVLVPLSDIGPTVVIPTTNLSVSAILDEMSAKEKKGVVKWEPIKGAEESKPFGS